MKNFSLFIILIALLFTVNAALTKGPKPPPAPEPNLMNVVTVSPEHGDFTSPVAAIDSILDANENNPYLVEIGPGIYDISDTPLRMKSYVKIQGAGATFTVIRGSRSGMYDDEDAALVIGANHGSLVNMSIENSSAGSYAIGIRNDNASPVIKNVRVAASLAVYNRGISNHSSSSPKLVNVNARADGGNGVAIAINGESAPNMLEVTAHAPSAGGTGIAINNSSPFIVDSKFVGDPALELGDYASGRVVNNMILGGVVRQISYTGGTLCRGNYDANLDDVDCSVTP